MAEGKGKPRSAGEGFLRGIDAGRRRIAKAGYKGEASRANSDMKDIVGRKKAAVKKKAAEKASMKPDLVRSQFPKKSRSGTAKRGTR